MGDIGQNDEDQNDQEPENDEAREDYPGLGSGPEVPADYWTTRLEGRGINWDTIAQVREVRKRLIKRVSQLDKHLEYLVQHVVGMIE